eukprot:UN25763
MNGYLECPDNDCSTKYRIRYVCMLNKYFVRHDDTSKNGLCEGEILVEYGLSTDDLCTKFCYGVEDCDSVVFSLTSKTCSVHGGMGQHNMLYDMTNVCRTILYTETDHCLLYGCGEHEVCLNLNTPEKYQNKYLWTNEPQRICLCETGYERLENGNCEDCVDCMEHYEVYNYYKCVAEELVIDSIPI